MSFDAHQKLIVCDHPGCKNTTLVLKANTPGWTWKKGFDYCYEHAKLYLDSKTVL
jgi:hypothetical protein